MKRLALVGLLLGSQLSYASNVSDERTRKFHDNQWKLGVIASTAGVVAIVGIDVASIMLPKDLNQYEASAFVALMIGIAYSGYVAGGARERYKANAKAFEKESRRRSLGDESSLLRASFAGQRYQAINGEENV